MSVLVDIEPDDAGFVSTGCGEWSPDVGPRVAPGEPFGDGSWIVGAEVEPGRYRAMAELGGTCRWERLHGSRESEDSTRTPGVSLLVDIEPDDAGFVSTGCGEWRRGHKPRVAPGEPFSDGLWIVGAEIAPGRYRAAEGIGEACRWERLHGPRESGDRARTQGVSRFVEIAADDTGFVSAECGGWTAMPSSLFGDGEHRVGDEITPGLYRALDPSEECAWERRAGDTVTGFGDERLWMPVVRIGDADTLFTSSGCGTWSDNPRRAITTFGDGAWFVGSEVAPGRYRASVPSASCRWWRLHGFEEEYGRKLERYGGDLPNVSGSDSAAVADILTDDAGFVSRGCGVWSSDFAPVATPGEPFGDGTFLVGIDISPGRYRAASPTEACWWERRRSFEAWLSYGHGRLPISSESQPIVDIASSDAGFVSRGCGVWSSDFAPVATPGEPFGDGTFIVGIDISPGRYRATGPPGDCWWQRLHGFGGDTTHGHYLSPDIKGWGHWLIVDIAESDAGFFSGGCGEWSMDIAPRIKPGQPFGDGTWLVGPEIEPGRYFANAPTDDCSWRRLEGFGGRTDRYDAGVGTGRAWDGPALLAATDIAGLDAAFVSVGCGVWSTEATPRVEPVGAPADGHYLVGIEVAPGRYYATSPHSCWFRRLSGFSGEYRDGIGYLLGNRELRHGIVDIEPSDLSFRSRGCGWTADLTPRVTPGQSFGDGTWVVGDEIAPGSYRSLLGTECYWQRLSKFGGSGGRDIGIIGRTAKQGERQTVTVAPSDLGFHSWGCGRWTPVAP